MEKKDLEEYKRNFLNELMCRIIEFESGYASDIFIDAWSSLNSLEDYKSFEDEE